MDLCTEGKDPIQGDQGIGGIDPSVEKRKGSYSGRSRYSIIGQGSPVEKRKGSY
jgi:hypothetical protein